MVLAVQKMMGIAAVEGLALSSCAHSKPDFGVIITSSRMSWGRGEERGMGDSAVVTS